MENLDNINQGSVDTQTTESTDTQEGQIESTSTETNAPEGAIDGQTSSESEKERLYTKDELEKLVQARLERHKRKSAYAQPMHQPYQQPGYAPNNLNQQQFQQYQQPAQQTQPLSEEEQVRQFFSGIVNQEVERKLQSIQQQKVQAEMAHATMQFQEKLNQEADRNEEFDVFLNVELAGNRNRQGVLDLLSAAQRANDHKILFDMYKQNPSEFGQLINSDPYTQVMKIGEFRARALTQPRPVVSKATAPVTEPASIKTTSKSYVDVTKKEVRDLLAMKRAQMKKNR